MAAKNFSTVCGSSPVRRIPVQDEGEVHPAIVEEHPSRERPRVKAGNVRISALGIDTYPQRDRNEIDEVTQRKNAAKLLQRLVMLKELALQCLGIVRDEILC